MIGETYFFRDEHPFETLREFVLPDLIHNQDAARQLNIWCAAASTGQEPYSLAMLLSEVFPVLANGRCRLIASDLSGSMLERARAGCYSQIEIERGLPASMFEQYFKKRGNDWQVSESIRRKVEFLRMNLIQDWSPLPVMDLILMRNVLIYFNDITKSR